jgi:hypothetical protein
MKIICGCGHSIEWHSSAGCLKRINQEEDICNCLKSRAELERELEKEIKNNSKKETK